MKHTDNFNLKKPEQTDFYNVEDFNENAEIIDAEIQNRKTEHETDASNIAGLTNPTFDDSGSVEGISSFPDFLTKFKSKVNIFQWFRDFKAGAQFILHAGQIVNNCVTNNAGLPLSAAQGKVLMDLINKLNGDLQTAYLLKGGTPIPAGADLKSDAYKVPGNYYVQLTSVVSSLLNLPAGITDAFTLKVEKGNGTDYPKQTFREYSSQKIVVRTFNSHDNTWTDGVSYVRNGDLTPVSMTTTRTENPYVSATSFNRIVAKKIGPNLLWVLFNVWIDLTPLPNSDDIVEIGKVNGISSASPSALINIPAQNGSGTILLDFRDNGVFKIANQSGNPVSGFVRTTFVAVVNFS